MELLNDEKSYLVKALLVLAMVVSLYFAVKVVTEIKNYGNIPGGAVATNTISFDGQGEVFAAPDLATVSFTIREEAKNVEDAQTKVTAKETAVLDFFEKSGIEKKDIKTESYNSFPKYDYGAPCYSYSSIAPCRQDAPKVIGYEVTEYISIKIRDLAKAGDLVKGIGAVGISEISGPNFSIENEDALKAEARKLAIDEAKAKAKVLSKDLGVRLVRIVNFYENGNYSPMYAKGMVAMDSVTRPESAPSPALPTGENKITSSVTITYEIR